MTTAEMKPLHPGAILRRELAERNMSQLDLATAMGRSPQTVNNVVTGKHSITPRTAVDLESVLGVSAQFWLNAKTAYDLAQERARRASETA
jgi:addiction module HigA family antidote